MVMTNSLPCILAVLTRICQDQMLYRSLGGCEMGSSLKSYYVLMQVYNGHSHLILKPVKPRSSESILISRRKNRVHCRGSSVVRFVREYRCGSVVLVSLILLLV